MGRPTLGKGGLYGVENLLGSPYNASQNFEIGTGASMEQPAGNPEGTAHHETRYSVRNIQGVSLHCVIVVVEFTLRVLYGQNAKVPSWSAP